MRHPTWLVCWLQSPMSHRGLLSELRPTAIMSSQDQSEIRWEGILRHCSSSMESAANRTQVDAFHASFQALLGSIKNIHLSYFRNLKFVFSFLICSYSVFCILALGSGQLHLYRLGSGLVLVLVLRFCAYSDGGVYSLCVPRCLIFSRAAYCKL